MNLTYKYENKLFKILFVISIISWLLLTSLTFGLALLYAGIVLAIALVAHSGFISHIKGNGIKVSDQQSPELYQTFKDCCEKLEIQSIPELYIINSDGILNALATRFLKRHYVIIYGSIVDALSDNPEAMRFYLGHELGHIKQKHLSLRRIVWPAIILPIIGPAYRRAQEYSCDLHGLYCCNTLEDASFALNVIAAGPTASKTVNTIAFGNQSKTTDGFWLSLYELVGHYPWLCKRIQHITDVYNGEQTIFPKRHKLAKVIAAFIPNFGTGGQINFAVVPVILLILLTPLFFISKVIISKYEASRAQYEFEYQERRNQYMNNSIYQDSINEDVNY